jgi:hypothetical protein
VRLAIIDAIHKDVVGPLKSYVMMLPGLRRWNFN